MFMKILRVPSTTTALVPSLNTVTLYLLYR